MGVEYFSCKECGETLCDCGPYFNCGCHRSYCTACAEKLMEKYKVPESLKNDLDEEHEIYECHYCNCASRIKMLRSKIKKMKKELIDLELSVIGL